MASFGAKYPHFSKIKTEPDDALPTYRRFSPSSLRSRPL